MDMRCLKMAAVKYVCCLFSGETKYLSKSLYVCVSVRFGHVCSCHIQVHPASARSWGNELAGGDCFLAE